MKYIVMDYKGGDLFTEEFATAEEAIVSAEYSWEHLTDKEKMHRESFFVLESINPDEEAENHLDGDIVRRWK